MSLIIKGMELPQHAAVNGEKDTAYKCVILAHPDNSVELVIDIKFASAYDNGHNIQRYPITEIPTPLKNIECDECQYFKARSRFVELPHAEWIEDEDICDYLIYRCSNCNERFVLEEGTPLDNCYFYCPNCGAKMDERALKERESDD